MFDPEQEDGTERQAPSSKEPEQETRPGFPLDPRRLIHALLQRKKWLIIAFVLGAVIGIVVGKFAIKKKYVASCTILWEPPEAGKSDAVRELSTLAESVKLPDNLREVRKRLALNVKLMALASRIKVEVGKNTMLITVAAEGHSPEEAADLANTTVEVFIEAQKRVSKNRLQQIVDTLRESLRQAEAALHDSEKRYQEFRKKHGIADWSVEQQTAIEQLAKLRVEASEAQVKLAGLEAKEKSLRKSRDTRPHTVTASRSEQRPDLARLAEAEAELAAARGKFTPNHPKVRALEAEVDALRAKVTRSAPAVTAEVVTRDGVRDTLTTKVEEVAALRRSIREQKRAIEQALKKVEKRANSLGAVEAEAARLLAEVKVGQAHVEKLLKQLAFAEDDVRSATSGFQILSKATPPPWAEKGLGKIVAAAIPILFLMGALGFVLFRELYPLRIVGANEAAYWTNSPVLWATAWPGGDSAERRDLSREVADALEHHRSIVGVILGLTTADDSDRALDLARIVAERLESRGISSVVTDGRNPPPLDEDMELADIMEHRSVGEHLESLQKKHPVVLVVLPHLGEMAAVRAARRWVDGVLLVLPSGKMSVAEGATLRKSLGIEKCGIALVVSDMPPWLLSHATRTFGRPETMWKC